MKLGDLEILLSNHQALGARQRQEDYFAFHIRDDGRGNATSVLLVLTDGMGGHEGGDEASVLAVNAFTEAMDKGDPSMNLADRMILAARDANDAVHRYSQGGEMGSTLVALHLDHQRRQWVSVGDSPIFRITDSGIERLNRDHNMGARMDEQLAEGLITQDEADWKMADRKLLTSSLGMEELEEVDVSDPEPILAGETFILASDGLTDALPIDEILQIVFRSHPESIGENLVAEAIAKERLNQDNVTVLSINISSPKKDRIRNVLDRLLK